MPKQPMPDSSRSPQNRSRGKRVLCAVLILIPVIATLTVPLYQRTSPTLAGIPFFYWFQMAMAVAAAAACGTAYFLLFRDEKEVD